MLTELQTKKWTHLFNLYDADNTGTVTKEDYELKAKTLAKELKLQIDSADYNKMHQEIMADWEHVKKDVDKNQDGEVSLDEWLEHGSTRINNDNMYETVKKEVDVIFALFDQDQDGSINREEYSTLIKSWGASDEDVNFACSKIDLGTGKSLSKDKFIELLEQFHKSDDSNATGNYMFGSF